MWALRAARASNQWEALCRSENSELLRTYGKDPMPACPAGGVAVNDPPAGRRQSLAVDDGNEQQEQQWNDQCAEGQAQSH